jgi:hypothetical protein
MASGALEFQVLSLGDLDEVYSFSEQELRSSVPDETERAFASWHARWRKEALEHYLRLGWSFIARDKNGETAGYFLAQPLLFFRGQTQTLWVEWIAAREDETRNALADVAKRVAREKNLQRVLYSEGESFNEVKLKG